MEQLAADRIREIYAKAQDERTVHPTKAAGRLAAR